jgi:uncharacterized protein YbjQ (UPF0145 family)
VSKIGAFSTFAQKRYDVAMILDLKGHNVFAIWLGKDLSAFVRLVVGGELSEYTEMMGSALTAATDSMIARAL